MLKDISVFYYRHGAMIPDILALGYFIISLCNFDTPSFHTLFVTFDLSSFDTYILVLTPLSSWYQEQEVISQ